MTIPMTSIDILFDSNGKQASIKGRLTGLYETIEAAGWSHETAPITEANLEGRNVLVLTNRIEDPYDPSEIASVVDFVHGGGGLWCMANHAHWNADDAGNNWVRYDSAIATTFFTDFQAAAYVAPAGATELDGDNLADHEIIQGSSDWPVAQGRDSREVDRVVTNTFCGIHPNPHATALVGLAHVAARNYLDGGAVGDGILWAVAIDDEAVTKGGRVVLCADGGWLGDTSSTSPGPGQFQEGHNDQFSLNVIAWLGRLRPRIDPIEPRLPTGKDDLEIPDVPDPEDGPDVLDERGPSGDRGGKD